MPQPDSSADSSRLERILAYTAIAVFALTVICFAALIIAPAAGVDDYTAQPWPTVVVFPLVGLPIAFALIVAVLALNWRRRSR